MEANNSKPNNANKANSNYIKSNEKNELSLQSILEELQVIKQALTGNSIGNDGGLVGRIRELEDEHIKQKQELRDIRDDVNKFKTIGIVILAIPSVIGVAKFIFDLVKH